MILIDHLVAIAVRDCMGLLAMGLASGNVVRITVTKLTDNLSTLITKASR